MTVIIFSENLTINIEATLRGGRGDERWLPKKVRYRCTEGLTAHPVFFKDIAGQAKHTETVGICP